MPSLEALRREKGWTAAQLARTSGVEEQLIQRLEDGSVPRVARRHMERLADALGVEIERTVIVEDSPVGVAGAVASGARVIGLCAGRHCLPGQGERLRALGLQHIAHSFDEVAEEFTEAAHGHTHGGARSGRVAKLFTFEGLERTEAAAAAAG
ncbi:MAG: helix-turn-helix domain-containing protein [Gemmatimonadetes bacterium]|nr:helix-turn-helix domain-containing protein [Gemmatimonadota bacterium]